jgi:hypothetical protein
VRPRVEEPRQDGARRFLREAAREPEESGDRVEERDTMATHDSLRGLDQRRHVPGRERRQS